MDGSRLQVAALPVEMDSIPLHTVPAAKVARKHKRPFPFGHVNVHFHGQIRRDVGKRRTAPPAKQVRALRPGTRARWGALQQVIPFREGRHFNFIDFDTI